MEKKKWLDVKTIIIKRKSLNGFAHITRKKVQRSFVYRSYKSNFLGKRARSRPSKRRGPIREGTGIPLLALEMIVLDRKKWQMLFGQIGRKDLHRIR